MKTTPLLSRSTFSLALNIARYRKGPSESSAIFAFVFNAIVSMFCVAIAVRRLEALDFRPTYPSSVGADNGVEE
jgi:hypothetical protein